MYISLTIHLNQVQPVVRLLSRSMVWALTNSKMRMERKLTSQFGLDILIHKVDKSLEEKIYKHLTRKMMNSHSELHLLHSILKLLCKYLIINKTGRKLYLLTQLIVINTTMLHILQV
jgi:hypothetical protein